MTYNQDHRNAARLFGLFFIGAFLSYGIGSTLVETVIGGGDILANTASNAATLFSGTMLMAIVHSFVNIALPLIMLPILRPYSERLTFGYLGAAIMATTILAIGPLGLLTLIPLAQEFGNVQDAVANATLVVGATLKAFNTAAYHMGMAIWAIGGMLFCAVLLRSDLLPRFLPIWGIFGYVVLAAGSVSELLAHNPMVETISVIPGGLFEVTLSLWLIFRGFNSHSVLTPANHQ